MPCYEEESDIVTFSPGKWLNDKEIDWVYQMLEERFSEKHSFISALEFPLLKNGVDSSVIVRFLKEFGKAEKELVFIPVNRPNAH